MTVLGGLAAIGCFVASAWVEPREPLIVFGAAALFVPASLHLLVMHGYRKVRDKQPPSS